jgi:putative membrane protein
VALAVALVAAGLAAGIHVLIFVLESILFARPAVWRRFGVRSQDDADTIRMWALNQGFYNLFLASGVVAGLIAVGLGHRSVGVALVALATASMAAAGVVLLATGGPRFLRAAAMQAVPPLVALAALVASAA